MIDVIEYCLYVVFIYISFESIGKKEDVIGRDYRYIVGNIECRKEFASAVEECMMTLGEQMVKGEDFYQMITLLCEDFVYKTIEFITMECCEGDKERGMYSVNELVKVFSFVFVYLEWVSGVYQRVSGRMEGKGKSFMWEDYVEAVEWSMERQGSGEEGEWNKGEGEEGLYGKVMFSSYLPRGGYGDGRIDCIPEFVDEIIDWGKGNVTGIGGEGGMEKNVGVPFSRFIRVCIEMWEKKERKKEEKE